jgi:Gamma-glutamylcysteine synthetase
MSIDLDSVISDKEQLINYFRNGSKSSSLKIGTEHEKFLFNSKNNKPISYTGAQSIEKIFQLLELNGWIPLQDGNNIIGLKKITKA